MGGFQEPRYLEFVKSNEPTGVDGKPMLNRYSTHLTRAHDFPGAQAMLFAAGVPDRKAMQTAPHVGIASVWWEGNPCNMHLLDLGKEVKKAVQNQGMLAWQYNAVGVSDAITMGNQGRSTTLTTRSRIVFHGNSSTG